MKCFLFNFHQFWVKINFSLKKNLIFWRLVTSLIFWCMTCANKELRRMHHWKNSGKKRYWCILLHGCWRNYTEFPRIAQTSAIVTCVKLSLVIHTAHSAKSVKKLKNWSNRKNSAKWASFSQYLYFYYQKQVRVSFAFLHSSKLWLFSREEVIRSYFTNLVENHYKNRIKG